MSERTRFKNIRVSLVYAPPVFTTIIATIMTTKKVILSAPNMTSRNPYT